MSVIRRLFCALVVLVAGWTATPTVVDAAEPPLSPAVHAASADSRARLAGATREETSVAISQRQFPNGAELVFLARADQLADAVAAGVITGAPTLLVPRDGDLPEVVRSEIARLNPTWVSALGGTSAISDEMLSQAAEGRSQGRIAGATRVDTAVEISRWQFPDGAGTAYLARSDNFADALAAGSVSDGPILLVPPGSAPESVRSELERLNVGRVTALGGVAAVSDASLTSLAGGRGTDRLAGATRVETAIAVAGRAFPAGSSEVFLARADRAVDAVAAGSLTSGPILLVAGCEQIAWPVLSEIGRLQASQVTALGGTAAICDATLNLSWASGQVTPESGGVAALGAYRLRVPARVVESDCWAHVVNAGSRVANAPDGSSTTLDAAADFHLDCPWSGQVGVSVPQSEAVDAGRESVFVPHLVGDIDSGEVRFEPGAALGDGTAEAIVSSLSISLSALGMNSAELSWCAVPWHVWTCWRAGHDLANEAESVTASEFGSGKTDKDRANAFKHCYWNARMVQVIGWDDAVAIGNNHEANSTGVDHDMDLKNNEVGRSIGAGIGLGDPRPVCAGKARNGGLWHIVNGEVVDTAQEPQPVEQTEQPPSGGALGITFWENPFTCDGAVRSFGRVTGAQPGERVDFTSAQLGALLSGTADSAGAVTIYWQCDPSESAGRWDVSARGASSGRSISFSVAGNDAPATGDNGGDGGGGGGSDNPDTANVSVSKGASAQGQPNCSSQYCRYVHVDFSGFASGSHRVACYSNLPGETDPFWVYDTSSTSSEVCYFGYPGRVVWVTVDGVRSADVAW